MTSLIWGYQVPALVEAGYTAIVINSRGQGRSIRDQRLYSYELMASDARAVMDALGVAKAAFIGWSDGADTALVLSRETPGRSVRAGTICRTRGRRSLGLRGRSIARPGQHQAICKQSHCVIANACRITSV